MFRPAVIYPVLLPSFANAVRPAFHCFRQ